MTSISGKLKALLQEKGLSASAVAELAGMEKQQAWRIIAGATPDPRVSTLRKIVEASGSSLAEFFADEH